MRFVRPGRGSYESLSADGRTAGRGPSTAPCQPTPRRGRRSIGRICRRDERAQLPDTRDERDLTVDEAIERFLTEYLTNEKGRADKTIPTTAISTDDGSPPPSVPGRSNGSRVPSWTNCSVQMRQAGLSASRLNQAKSLYAPFFRWAKRRGMTCAIRWPISRCPPAPTDPRNELHPRSRSCRCFSPPRSK